MIKYLYKNNKFQEVIMQKFNIYQRKDGRFEGRIQAGKSADGTRKYVAFFGQTRKQVEEKMTEHRRNQTSDQTTEMTLTELFAAWKQRLSFRLKESTLANYSMKMQKHLIPYFAEKSLSEITSEDIYAFIREKLKSGLSNRYVSDMITLLKSLFKYAVRKFRIANPMEEVEFKREKTPEIRLLNAEEEARLGRFLAENPSRTAMGIILCKATGLRIGELCALTWNDIDFEKRILTVKHTIQRIQAKNGLKKTKLIITEPKSESSKRSIPIPEFLLEFLKNYQGKPNEFILSGMEKPVEPRTMQNRFAKILKNAKLPSMHFHALRHMFATKCIKLGFDMKTLSEILGHSSIEITMNLYVHSSFDRKQEMMNLQKSAF